MRGQVLELKRRHLSQLADHARKLYIKPDLRHLFFELTLQCNEHCFHCGSNCTSAPSDQLTLEEYKKACPVFDESIYDAINLDNCVQRRNLPVAQQLRFLDDFLKK